MGGLRDREEPSMEDATIAFESLFTRIPKIPLYNNVLLLAKKLSQREGSVLDVIDRVGKAVEAYMSGSLSQISGICGESLGGDAIIVSTDTLSLACAREAARRGSRVYLAWHDLMGPLGGGEDFKPVYFYSSFLYHAIKSLKASLVIPLFSVTKTDALAPPQSLEAAILAGDMGRGVIMVAPRLSVDPLFGPLSSLPIPKVVVEREIGYSFDFPVFDVIAVGPETTILAETGPLEVSLEALLDAQRNVINELSSLTQAQ